MAIYDFQCADCGAAREVLLDYQAKDGLELLCVQCGGVMKAVPVNRFFTTLKTSGKDSAGRTGGRAQTNAKPCGHTHRCHCADAIKATRPNPFQGQIDETNNAFEAIK